MPTDHIPARLRRRATAFVLGTILLASVAAAGCSNAIDTPAPSSAVPATPAGATLQPYSPGPSPSAEDPAVVYARIEDQVQTIRGLTALAPVTPRLLDAAGLETELLARFDKQNPPAYIAAEQQLYQGLGMYPANSSLHDQYRQMLASQVAGFYRADTKQLFVVSKSGAIGATQQITFAHEFDHALQDQHFGLAKLGLGVVDQGDRSLARLSLTEGDATLLMSDWAQAEFTPLQMLQLLQESADPTQSAILNSMPPLLRDDLLFPYQSGLSFVEGLWASGGWPAVDAAYANPPDSTEQILHSEKYLAHEPPVQVTIPADIASRLGAGWTTGLQDTFGEFGLREWLQVAGGVAPVVASDAAAGWGGDRVVLVTGPGGRWGIAIVSAWDTSGDADAFATAAGSTIARMPHADVFRPVAGRVAVVVGSDVDIRARLANILGFAG